LQAGLTLTVGGAQEDDFFPAAFTSVPRHVPDEWIAELRSIGSGQQLEEDDGFDEPE